MFSHLFDFPLGKDQKLSNARKLEWLRSQIIGQYVDFETPFGKRMLTYADHTASGRSLLFIEDFIFQRVLPVYGNTHTEDSFVGTITGKFVQEAAKYVKTCMGGTDDEAILFCGSGSTAAIKRLQEVMGIAVPSTLREQILENCWLDERQRWVVFVGPYEHHSNLLSWRQSLAEVVEIPLSKDGLIDMAKLKVALKDPRFKGRPKLGSFSAGSNVTGVLTNTRSVARLLHSHGSFACFDFAACAPYVKIDMRSGKEDGYDAIFVSPHKFMGGPGTPGILLMGKQLYLLRDHPPSTCGGGTVDFVNYEEENTIYHNEIEHREYAGTPAIIQIIRTALAYSVKEFLSTELIESRENCFVEAAMARLGKSSTIEVYGKSALAKRTGIFSFGVHPPIPPSMTNFPCPSPLGGSYTWNTAPNTPNNNPAYGSAASPLWILSGNSTGQNTPNNNPTWGSAASPIWSQAGANTPNNNPYSGKQRQHWWKRVSKGARRFLPAPSSTKRIVNPFRSSWPSPLPRWSKEHERSRGAGNDPTTELEVGNHPTRGTEAEDRAAEPDAFRDLILEDEALQAARKPLDARFVVKLLNDLFGIQSRGGCSCAAPYGHGLLNVDPAVSLELRTAVKQGYSGAKLGWARVSFGYYISKEEFEFILSAVEFIGEFGVRFLGLYDFDWTTGDWTFKPEFSEQIQDIVAEAEKKIFGGKKQRTWDIIHLQFPGPGASPFDSLLTTVPSFSIDDYIGRLLKYLKLARHLAECLPEQPPRRGIPYDLDPAAVLFRV